MSESRNRPYRPEKYPPPLPASPARWLLGLALILTTGSLRPVSAASPGPATNAVVEQADRVRLPRGVPDPLEPVNRVLWTFNQFLLADAVQPTARAYRFVVRPPVRRSISNFGRNLGYPGRLANNLLEGKWTGARDETGRFICNSIAGLGGLFDVATQWKIPRSDADFGRTFGQWGWQPDFFLMLPVLGPSNDRDTVGLAADALANPITYFSPYSYGLYGIQYNNLTDSVDAVARLSEAELDPYSFVGYAWSFADVNRKADFQLHGPPEESSLETLGAALVTFEDPEFPNRGRTEAVRIAGTGRRLKFSTWLQSQPAPLVYLVPGLGAHRLTDPALALAELLYQHGYSVVILSNPYNYEFMEQAATAPLPGYTPADAQDLRAAMTAIDERLEKRAPHRLGDRALLGYSMGAFLSLYLGATQDTNQSPGIKFARVVGVNTPVRLLYGIGKLDEYYDAPLAWPAAERSAALENTLLKVAAVKRALPPTGAESTAATQLPFSGVESRFLIGMNFRFILRDIIYSSQRRHNLGIIPPIHEGRRAAAYEEILTDYSYADYIDKFVVPFYRTNGVTGGTREAVAAAGDLRSYAAGFAANHNLRLVLNRNDFLLPEEDLNWLRSVTRPDQLTLFEHGGHLGSLGRPEVHAAIIQALAGLGPPPTSDQAKNRPGNAP